MSNGGVVLSRADRQALNPGHSALVQKAVPFLFVVLQKLAWTGIVQSGFMKSFK